ncbi:MAG: holo-ACP synthase [Opitutaceae bacterium]|nr:holo-ACP synthase [Opitutaceae bacterium]
MTFDLPPGGILLSLGTDIVDVARIRGAHERHGERFLSRIFTDEERTYCLQMAHPHKHLAARFAAKEAVSKAFSTGIGSELGWKSMSIYHGPRMDPRVRLDESALALLKQLGGTQVLVSLSHTDTAALAVAAIVRG